MNQKAFKLLWDLLTLNKFYREYGITYKDFKQHLTDNGMGDICVWMMLFETQRMNGPIVLDFSKFDYDLVFYIENKMVKLRQIEFDRVEPTEKQRKQLGKSEIEEWYDGDGKDFIGFILNKK